MKKKILVIMISCLILPQITLAAWWKPSTWFGKEEIPQPVFVKETEKVSVEKPTIDSPKPKDIPTTKQIVVERVVEKPIIQTVVVQDPSLQSRINDLINENKQLKIEIEKLEKINQGLNDELFQNNKGESLKKISLDKKCQKAKIELHSVENDIQNVRDKYTDLITNLKSSFAGSTSGLVNETNRLNQQMQDELAPLNSQYNRVNYDYKLYCN